MEGNQLDFSMVMASAVHDMKNSLSMLLHSIDVMCEELPEDLKAKANTTTIQYEAERVNNYLIQLLGLYRLQENSLRLHVDEHFIEELLSEQGAQYDALLGMKNIELNIDCDYDLAWYLDRELVMGVLNNALTNAARYTNSKIGIVTEIKDDYLSIGIHDDGRGYPDSMLDCEPGTLLKNINFANGSTSLGIYFASEIAKMHQAGEKSGHIALSNGGLYGGGVFEIHLP